MGSIYKREKFSGSSIIETESLTENPTQRHDITKAQTLLKKREGEIAEGKLPGNLFR